MAISFDLDIEDINPRFLMWLCLAFLLAGAALYPLFIGEPEIADNSTKIITQIEYVKVLVTPTPDGIIYFATQYQSGTRKLLQPFSWIRKNVSGNKDMMVTANAYSYMSFEQLHWFNPSDNQYYEANPQSGNRFLFVFFNIYMDDEVFDDTRLWLPKENVIYLHAKNTAYPPSEYLKQVRFKELENVHNLADTSYVQAYGQYVSYSADLEDKGTGGIISINEYYLKGGKSNAQDGYILFEIPKEIDEKEITFRVSFSGFGWSAWRLAV